MAERAARSPRVCMLVRSFPEASEAFVVDRFLGLLRRGWDVHVVCAASDAADWGRFPELAAEPSVRARVHVSWPRRTRWLAAALVAPALARGLIRRPRAALRYLTRGAAELGADVVRRFSLDAEVVCLDPDLIDLGLDDAASRLYLERLLDARIVASVVDIRVDDPDARRHDAVAGTAERPLRILGVGHLDWRHGYDYALATVRALERRGVRCIYRVAGEGDYLEPAAFLRRQFGLDRSVEFLGACDRGEVVRQMQWADVLLHTALAEVSSDAVVEAHATALPVVCSDTHGGPESVVDGATAFVVPRWTSEPAAEALERLARRPELRQRLGDTGRALVAERFDLADHVAGWERLYRETLEPRVSVDLRTARERVVGAAHGAD